MPSWCWTAPSRGWASTATTSNSGLTGLTSNAGTLAIQLGSSITTGAAFTNSGLLAVDADIFGTGDAGGSRLAFGGVLTNKGDLDIGNSGLTAAATVTATGLTNAANGTIDLTGDTAQATLNIAGAAPSVLDRILLFAGQCAAGIRLGACHRDRSEFGIVARRRDFASGAEQRYGNRQRADPAREQQRHPRSFRQHNYHDDGICQPQPALCRRRQADPRRGTDQQRQCIRR